MDGRVGPPQIIGHEASAEVAETGEGVEGFAVGDRVAVLKDGYLQQVDTPQNLYDRPDNVFVAAFIGSPSMNLYAGQLTVVGDGGFVTLGSQTVAISPKSRHFMMSANEVYLSVSIRSKPPAKFPGRSGCGTFTTARFAPGAIELYLLESVAWSPVAMMEPT